MIQAEAKIFFEKDSNSTWNNNQTNVKWDYKITEKFLQSKERFPGKHLCQLYTRQRMNIKDTKRTLEINHQKNQTIQSIIDQ